MKAAGHFVIVLAEFSARVQGREQDFHGAEFGLAKFVHRDASSVVIDGDAVVFFEKNFNGVTMSVQRFIHGVVQNFP